MAAAFEQALGAYPKRLCEACYTFAGQHVQIRIIGQELAKQISLPFSHLLVRKSDVTRPRLRIDLWDESETAISRPVGSAGLRDEIPRSEGFREYCLLMGSRDNRFIGCQRSQMLTWSDRVAQHITGCATTRAPCSVDQRGKPLHLPLLLWHSDQDAEVIHAGLVSKDGHGALFAGQENTGKTTAALACLSAGFDYLGDDYIGLQTLPYGSFVGHSLYGSTWLAVDHMARFPYLIPHAIRGKRPDESKALVQLAQVFPSQLAQSAPICAVVLPRVSDDGRTQICVASKRDALLALAPSSILLLPISKAQTLNTLGQLIESVPCYWLEMGQDLDTIPRCVEGILDEVDRL
jgi:hypothetical protein